jgi:hypothetical protein
MRKFPAFRPVARILVAAAMLPVIAEAHPGHEGHELTWDMRHLAAHPWATLGCFAVIGGVAWLAGAIAVRLRADHERAERSKDQR